MVSVWMFLLVPEQNIRDAIRAVLNYDIPSNRLGDWDIWLDSEDERKGFAWIQLGAKDKTSMRRLQNEMFDTIAKSVSVIEILRFIPPLAPQEKN